MHHSIYFGKMPEETERQCLRACIASGQIPPVWHPPANPLARRRTFLPAVVPWGHWPQSKEVPAGIFSTPRPANAAEILLSIYPLLRLRLRMLVPKKRMVIAFTPTTLIGLLSDAGPPWRVIVQTAWLGLVPALTDGTGNRTLGEKTNL
uniref:Transposase n=1 Tax=Globodera pallida TaxID=36090 RepID=A0A183CBR9_GLOPA